MDSKKLSVRTYTGGMAQTNGYLLGSAEKDDSCILVDAPEGICDWLDQIEEHPTDLLLTHQHYDHVEDAAKLASRGVRLHAFAPCSQELTLELLLQQSGLPVHIEPYDVTELLEGKEHLSAAGLEFELRHVPGHSPDSVVFIHNDLIFAGDTLFAGSVGRADLPGGDMELLLSGIKNKLLGLPRESRVFPGHGHETSIGMESSNNPFL